jgi:hypothetical protein
MGVKGETFPHPSVVDDYLSTIDPEEVNQLLVELFISCQKSKIFYNHCATLLPPQSFHIGVDGFWVHHYHKPHASDEAGNNKCPYCLPRVHHKGTLQEKTTWVHVFVTFVMIFPGRLTLPIYVYPLKSKQVNASKADDDLKQECELIAARAVLPIIRKLFPRLQITFLGDSLYANHPFINLCTSLHIEFLIVRKEKSLPVVAKQCDELATLELYETHYKHHEKEKTNEGFIERKCCWFNRIYLGGDTSVNVLRFSEKRYREGREFYAYQNEWLCSSTIKAGNCFSLCFRGRLRWDHEDLHNTAKNRGFNAKHDYARADPNLWLVWKLLMFVAFFIFELFSPTLLAREAKGSRSWMKFAKDLLEQLVNVLWIEINASQCLQRERIQFRYQFDTS